MVCVWLGVGVCVCSVLSNSSCGSVVVGVLAMFISSQESYVDRSVYVRFFERNVRCDRSYMAYGNK